jgi:hypothetical protein
MVLRRRFPGAAVITPPVPGPRLATLLDQLEAAAGPTGPVPSTDGWRLVLAEKIGYLVNDDRRRRAVAKLEVLVGLAPESILAAQDATQSRRRPARC